MRPAPYPADTRAKGWRFEVDMEKVKASDTWLRAKTGALRGALLLLWSEAWQQTPCGSLPNDDELVALIIDMSPQAFAKSRSVLMRGWWLADDGRLYHDTIAERVLQMLDTRGADRTRQDARRNLFEAIRERDGRACVYCGHTKYLTLDHLLPVSRGGDNNELNLAIACRPCNSKKRDRTPEEAGMVFANPQAAERWRRHKESGGEKRMPAEHAGYPQSDDTRTGTGTTTAAKAAARASRLPKPFDLPADWADWARDERPDLDPFKVAAKFADYWHGKPGKAGTKLDWLATWRNWVREERPVAGASPQARTFNERDAAARAARIDEMTGGLLRRTTSDFIDMEDHRAPAITND